MADFLLSVGIDINPSFDRMQKDIKHLVSKLQNQNPKINIGINIDKKTLNVFKSQISEIEKSFNSINTTNSFDSSLSGLNRASSSVKSSLNEIKSASLSIKKEYEKINKTLNNTDTSQSSKEISSLKQKYTEYQTAIKKTEAILTSATNNDIQKIKNLQTETQNLINTINQRNQIEKHIEINSKKAHQSSIEGLKKENDQIKKNCSESLNKNKLTIDQEIKKQNVLRQSYTLMQRMENSLRNWSGAKYGKSSVQYENIQNNIKELKNLNHRYKTTNMSIKGFKSELASINTSFATNANVIKRNSEATKNWGDRIKSLTSKFSVWFSISQIVMYGVRTVKDMVTEIKNLDSAMTDLKKVTNETNDVYDQFLINATNRAKNLGSTISDTIKATTEFSRLGYSISDAEKLADAAVVYKNVGDGIETISDASESIIATMQAFNNDFSPDEAMLLVDKFNEVGNKLPISSKGIGDSLMRSAAAMKAANNSLDETIALSAAANSVVQDPEKVGTALKTVSMYLRAAKTEAKDAGESTEGMAKSVSNLRTKLLRLTGSKVDIQIDENSFKSTYSILKELSNIWGELSDISQANILSSIGGKRNANIVSAILNNFDVAEKALKASSESAGSALKENEKQLESIEGKVSIFKAHFQELSNNFISGDFAKGVISLGTSLLKILNAISKIINSLGGLNTILYTTASIFTILKIDKIIQKFSKLKNKIISLAGVFRKITSAAKVYHAMTKANTAANATALVAYGSSTSALGRLSAAFAAVGISASVAQLKMLLIIAAISAIVIAVKAYKRSQEEAERAAEESYNKSIERANKATETHKSLIDLISQYRQLANEKGETWSSDQLEKVSSIQENITNLVGKQSDELDLVNGKLDIEYRKLANILKITSADTYQSASSAYIQTKKKSESVNKDKYLTKKRKEETEFSNTILDAYRHTNNKDFTDSQRWWIDQVKGNHSISELDTKKKIFERNKYNDITLMLYFTKDIESRINKLKYLKKVLLDAQNTDNFDKDISSSLAFLDEKISEQKEIFDDMNTAKNQKDLSKATLDVSTFISENDIPTQEEINNFLEKTISDSSSYDYSKSVVNTLVTFVPELEIPDKIKRKILIDKDKLLKDLSGSFSVSKPLVETWLDSLDTSKYEKFIGWWEANKSDKQATKDLDTMVSYFERYYKNMIKASISLEDHIKKYTELKNSGKASIEEINKAFSEMMNAYVRESKNKIDDLWNSEDFAEIKEELKNIVKIYGKISPNKIRELASEGSELAEILDIDGMNAEFLANILTQLSEEKDGLSLVTSEALQLNEALDGMSNEFNKISRAKSKYDELMKVNEKDTEFKTMCEAFKVLNNEFKEGTTNSNAFWAAAEYLFGSEQLAIWGWEDGIDKIHKSMKENIEIFKESEDAGHGFLERLYDISKAGRVLDSTGDTLANIKKNANGSFDFDIDYDNISKLADKMSLSEEAVLSCIKALSMWSDIDFYDIEEVMDVIEDIGLVAEKSGKKAINLDQLKQQLRDLGKTDKDIASVISRLEGLDNVTLINSKMSVEDLIKSIQSLGFTAKQGATLQIDYQQLIDMMQKMNFSKEEIRQFIEKLGQVDGVAFTKQLGEGTGGVTDLAGVLDHLNGLDFSSTKAAVDNVASAVNSLNDTLTGVDGKSVSVTVDIKGSIKELFKGGKGIIPGIFKGANAKGTDNAQEGISLVGEEGEELVQSKDSAYLVGTDGPELRYLRNGDKVYTANETRKIKRSRGKILRHIPTFSQGGVYGNVRKRRWEDLLSEKSAKKNSNKNTKTYTNFNSNKNTHSPIPTAKNTKSNYKNTDVESEFKRLYNYHKHLRAMDAESVSDYLTWLNAAYKKAYDKGEIDLDDYYNYQEEVHSSAKDLFTDYLDNIEHEISMRENYEQESNKIISIYNGLIIDIKNEINAARQQGLDNTDEYIQKLQNKYQDYSKAIKDIQKEITDTAKDSVDELIDYKSDMIKQEIENQKDALDKRLDNLKDFYDKQKESLEKKQDEEEYIEEQSEKRKTISDLKSSLAELEYDNSAWAQKRKIELNDELLEAEKELKNFEKESALDSALDALDNAYNAQEEKIEQEMSALDEKLNNPEAIYNKALTEIKQNTGYLYAEMLKYNKKYGSGNDNDVTDIYEEAYKSLLKYKNTYGKNYKGIILKNSTNYKPESSSWDKSSISIPSKNTVSKPKTTYTPPKKHTPSLSKNSSITVKSSATHFASKSRNIRMKPYVPGGKYTVYKTSGDQVLIGRNGVYTGWIKKSDIVGYAKGTQNATSGFHSIDELGAETIFESANGSKYKMFSGGEKVLNAKASDFLYNFANTGGEILKKNINKAFNGDLFKNIRNIVTTNKITTGDIIINGNTDTHTVSEIRRAQRDNVYCVLKGLNKLNK